MASAAPFFAEDDRGVWQRARATGNNPHHADPDLCSWSRDMAGTISDRLNNRGFSRQRGATNGFFKNAVSHNSSKSFQNSSPSLPNEHGAEDMDRASPRVARNVDRDEVRNGLHLAIVTKIPQYRNPAKEVATLADTSEGTVRSLRQANIPEAMVTLVMLGRAFPDFRSEVARLMGMERDLDPDFQRQFAALLQRVL